MPEYKIHFEKELQKNRLTDGDYLRNRIPYDPVGYSHCSRTDARIHSKDIGDVNMTKHDPIPFPPSGPPTHYLATLEDPERLDCTHVSIKLATVTLLRLRRWMSCTWSF